MKEPWFQAYIIPDIRFDAKAWRIGFALLPSRRLMTRADDGRMILAALRVEIGLIWQTRTDFMEGRFRPRLRLHVWSDADEIATRLALPQPNP